MAEPIASDIYSIRVMHLFFSLRKSVNAVLHITGLDSRTRVVTFRGYGGREREREREEKIFV